jgi:hypothetical protein
MKIKNVILASLLTKMGLEVKAELIVDDSNGLSITFPDISAVSEIAEGVAVDVPDGTYVVANDPDTITMVVLAGVITSLMIETPTPAAAAVPVLDSEVEAVLTAIVETVASLKTEHVKVVAELKDLKASLKHGKEAPAPAAGSTKTQFKVIG